MPQSISNIFSDKLGSPKEICVLITQKNWKLRHKSNLNNNITFLNNIDTTTINFYNFVNKPSLKIQKFFGKLGKFY